MDGKAELLAAIDNPNGISEEDWFCVMGLIDQLSPIWEDVACHRKRYYIPKKLRAQLKEIIEDPTTIIIKPDEDEEEDVMYSGYDETLPDHERFNYSARRYYELAQQGYDIGDFDSAFNDIEKALEIDGTNPEYLSFSGVIAFAIDKSASPETKVVEAKEIDVSLLRCGACSGPYNQATGHAFFVGIELKGVACQICAGRYFAKKLRKNGWKGPRSQKKQDRMWVRVGEAQRALHLMEADRIIKEARSGIPLGVYPWPDGE
jgi:tetratricopeptide (TPR) repeat protein